MSIVDGWHTQYGKMNVKILTKDGVQLCFPPETTDEEIRRQLQAQRAKKKPAKRN